MIFITNKKVYLLNATTPEPILQQRVSTCRFQVKLLYNFKPRKLIYLLQLLFIMFMPIFIYRREFYIFCFIGVNCYILIYSVREIKLHCSFYNLRKYDLAGQKTVRWFENTYQVKIVSVSFINSLVVCCLKEFIKVYFNYLQNLGLLYLTVLQEYVHFLHRLTFRTRWDLLSR